MPKRASSSRNTSSKPVERDAIPPGTDVPDSGLFFNRELSWLAFNNRVLQLAEDTAVPLMERVKFCAIYARNLDEFFMIRVARLHEQVRNRVARLVPDGATPGETLDKLHDRILEQGRRHSDCFERQLRPALAEKGLRILSMKELDAEARAQLDQRFREQIFPVLTPLAIGLGRHFPYISNLSLSLAVLLRDPVTETENVARVKVPKELLPRFVPLKGGTSFVPLEEIIAHHLDALFPGMEVLDRGLFRVTRDADFTVSEDAEDLLVAVQTELRQRRFGDVIRLEVQAGMSPKLLEPLMEALALEPRQLYEEQGLLDYTDLMAVVATPGFAELRDPPWTPVTQPRLKAEGDSGEVSTVLSAMRRGDLLVHHPYESFATSVERFVTEAVEDPDVLAIKQTVYRTSDKSPLVPALIRATERGKQARVHGGAQGALRRAHQHPVGAGAGGGGGARRLRHPRPQDARQGHPHRPPRGRAGAPLRPHGHRQLQLEDGPPLHGPGALHHGPGDRRGRGGPLQLPHRLRPSQVLPQAAGGPHQHARGPAASRSARPSPSTRPSAPPAS